jgi:hypothetical protein
MGTNQTQSSLISGAAAFICGYRVRIKIYIQGSDFITK